jgi:glycosyltransferase involved in cell wall biosynthesis
MISCIMITQPSRLDYQRKAVSDFYGQSYPRRELVIVEDENDGTTLGELRNRGVERAKGDIICVWDDDDRHHPDRLADQLQTMADADVCLLDQVTLHCQCGFQGPSMKRLWECTMMARKDALPPYPHIETHEDWHLVKQLRQERVIRTHHDPDLYLKLYHGGNTLSGRHYRKLFSQEPTSHGCEYLS